MLASSKHKYSKTLAFPDTYYELIINVLQSVELFCAYYLSPVSHIFPSEKYGIGLYNVENSVKKYGGTLKITSSNNFFDCNILLSNTSPNT